MTWNGIELEGLRSIETGRRYIRVTDDDLERSVLVPHGAFAGNGGEGLNLLKQAGQPVIGTKDSAALVSRVAAIKEFTDIPIAEKVGWNGSIFVLPSGQVIFPTGSKAPESSVPTVSRKCETSGTLEQWREAICEPLLPHPVLRFFMMSMFAAPILSLTPFLGNLAFELCSPKGFGKTSVQRLMASVAGGAGQGLEGHYYVNFDTTLNALEDAMARHSDCPLILEESNLYKAELPHRVLATRFQMLAFKLWSGSTKDRKGDPAGLENRLMAMISTNDPLASLIGEDSDSALAASDRLLTIPLSATRAHGTLDCFPDGFSSEAAFVDALLEATSRFYGTAFPRFIQQLVDDRATSEDKLKAAIAESMATFRERAGVTGGKGSEVRVANAFGVVYAAGRLAIEYGVLPPEFACGPAALDCYHLHINRASAGFSFAECIQVLSERPDVVDLGRGRLRELTEQELATGLFIRRGREGRELIILPAVIERYVPEWKAKRKRAEVRRLINREDGTRQRILRKICADRPKLRVYSFKLTN